MRGVRFGINDLSPPDKVMYRSATNVVHIYEHDGSAGILKMLSGAGVVAYLFDVQQPMRMHRFFAALWNQFAPPAGFDTYGFALYEAQSIRSSALENVSRVGASFSTVTDADMLPSVNLRFMRNLIKSQTLGGSGTPINVSVGLFPTVELKPESGPFAIVFASTTGAISAPGVSASRPLRLSRCGYLCNEAYNPLTDADWPDMLTTSAAMVKAFPMSVRSIMGVRLEPNSWEFTGS